MDVSMIIAAVGDIVKTRGSSIAMVAVGPRPGRTPITVPMRLPTRAMARFRGWSATAKPWSRWSNMGGSLPEEREDAEREAHAEPDREGEVEDGARGGSEARAHRPAPLAEEAEHEREGDRRPDREPDVWHEREEPEDHRPQRVETPVRGEPAVDARAGWGIRGVLLGVVRAGRGAADEPPRPGEREREPEDGGERGRPGHPGHLVERGDRPGLPEVAEGHERDHEPLDARARHQSVRRRHCVLLGPRRGGAYLANPSSLRSVWYRACSSFTKSLNASPKRAAGSQPSFSRSALHSGEASIFFTVSVQNWTASAGAPGAM